jgi:bacterioferritin-associated ferredoxin
MWARFRTGPGPDGLSMIVCHCHRVSDRAIRAAVRAGAQCEASVADACGAGSACGGCRPAVEELIAQERQQRRLPLIPSAA